MSFFFPFAKEEEEAVRNPIYVKGEAISVDVSVSF